MQPTPLLYAPPDWAELHSRLVLWHGCLETDAVRVAAGVDLAQGRATCDFGRGFYTTTVRRQAEQWARKRYADQFARGLSPSPPVVVMFVVPVDEMAALDSLSFVLGDADQDRFWSFVHHCRSGSDASPRTHRHPAFAAGTRAADWYDAVFGPVAAFWEQRVAMLGADQISFHTPRGAAILNVCDRSDPAEFEVVRFLPATIGGVP